MACGEYGPGRMAEPAAIFEAIKALAGGRAPAAGRQARAGHRRPDAEPIDPVRCSPTARPASRATPSPPPWRAGRRGDPGERAGDRRRSGRRDGRGDRGREMLAACARRRRRHRGLRRRRRRLGRPSPPAPRSRRAGAAPPALALARTPTSWRRCPRARAAEAGGRLRRRDRRRGGQRQAKRARKGCDWIVANDVSRHGTMGGERTPWPSSAPRGRGLADAGQGRGGPRLAGASRAGWLSVSPRQLNEAQPASPSSACRTPGSAAARLRDRGRRHGPARRRDQDRATWRRLPVPTGLAMALPAGFEAQVRPRSGLAPRPASPA